MANSFEAERLEYIEKLEATEKLFDDLFKLDKNGMVIGVDERKTLGNLQKRNKTILNKLESREFTVAIVGLEKAGKSTLGNALMKQNILPADEERCTFTKTEIRAGNNDEVEIRFFTKSDFDKKIQGMFEAVKYEGTPSLSAFNNYWETVDPSSELYLAHNDKTVKDIKNILEGWNTISGLLNHETLIFTDKKDREEQAKIYITGVTGFKTGDVAERGAQPYAVENIIIRSTQLKDMENIVLHDVPGFDSPTKLHKDQTKEMLRDADAIILVNNSGTNPNLTGTQLDTLKSVRDEDGILLNQKAFAFGNRIDMSTNIERAKSVLEEEAVKTYQLVSSKNRVLVGSAKAYLEKLGILDSKECCDKLDGLGMTYGVDELRQKMQEYYDTDRFVILKNRAENTIEAIKKCLQEIKEKYPKLDEIDDGGNIHIDINNKARDIFIGKSTEITNEYRQEIEEERLFSHLLEDSLDTIFKNECEEILKDVEYNTTYKSSTVPLTTIDGNIREIVQQKYVKNIVETVASITDEKQREIRNTLIDSFLDCIKTEVKTESLKSSVNELFDDFLIKNGSKCQFNILVERFATGIIEALIYLPFASHQRREKIDEIKPDLINLGYYYRLKEEKKEIFNRDNRKIVPWVYIATRILCHTDEDTYFEYGDDKEAQAQWDLIEKNFSLQSKEQLVEVLNDDIDILVDLTKNSLLDVIGLEKAFNRVIAKNISSICKKIELDEDGKEQLAVWIKDNARKIRPTAFYQIDVEIENNKIRKDIVKSIDEVLKNWNN